MTGGVRDRGRFLIVTADDFGLSREVNEAVEIAHRAGILSAASLMAGAPAAGDAVSRAKRMPGLRVGLHLVLTDGKAMLPHADLSDLTLRDGRFRHGMARAALKIALSRRTRQQLRAEIAAQFEAFRATGLVLDHVNAHKHFHLIPSLAGLILPLARRHRAPGIRVPFEPAAVLRRAEPATTQWPRIEPILAVALKRQVARAGFAMTDAVHGLAWSGHMSPGRLRAIICHLRPGAAEIYLHPATSDRFEGSAGNCRYTSELAALLDPGVAEAFDASGRLRAGYADLATAASFFNGVAKAH